MSCALGMLEDRGGIAGSMFGGSGPERAFRLADVRGGALSARDVVYGVALLLLVNLVLGGDEVLPDGVSRLEVYTYAPFGQFV